MLSRAGRSSKKMQNMSATSMSDSLCVIIVQYQTPDLLTTAVESFRSLYHGVLLVLVDNGSRDGSRTVIEALQRKHPACTRTIFLDRNEYHGPAMHRALGEVSQECCMFLDSDTKTIRGGFLEDMQRQLLASDRAYAIGREQRVNARGFKSEKGIDIIMPAYMMIRRSIYLRLPPFRHHGQPVLENFTAAIQNGYELLSYPVEEYIEHEWRGTASKFGYGLGCTGKLNFILNKLGL
jgi:glycosyltransferase involved in cell wall biosynthesis